MNNLEKTMNNLNIPVKDIPEFLNSLLKRDPQAISSLVDFRVPSNVEIQNHPFVTVNEEGSLGIMGILNGLLSLQMSEKIRIAAQYDQEGEGVSRFFLIDSIGKEIPHG